MKKNIDNLKNLKCIKNIEKKKIKGGCLGLLTLPVVAFHAGYAWQKFLDS